MATVSLPGGVRIKVIAYTQSNWRQRITLTGPNISYQWEGLGEPSTIGETEIQGAGATFQVQVKCEHIPPNGGGWAPNRESTSGPHDYPLPGNPGKQFYVHSEDDPGGDGDGNDANVRFIWPA